jgi:hypothetical protein
MRPCEDWGLVLDRLAAALLVQPLLVAAALHPAGHLLAREVVTCANLFGQARRGLSCALQQHLDTLGPGSSSAGGGGLQDIPCRKRPRFYFHVFKYFSE